MTFLMISIILATSDNQQKTKIFEEEKIFLISEIFMSFFVGQKFF